MENQKFTSEIEKFIQENYGVKGEKLWKNYPNDEVFRHLENPKWFGIIMQIEKGKIGMEPARDKINIIDLKCDPADITMLTANPGFFQGYHMNHYHWITIILDGTVDMKIIKSLIKNSYLMTG